MWNIGNRGVIVLISALSGCAFLYNIWGPILFLATSLFLVLYVCYSLLVNDSPLSPHAFILFEYIREALLEAHSTVQTFLQNVTQYGRNFWVIVNERSRAHFATIMNRPRRNHYQLSTDDTYTATKSSPRFSSIARLSPIPRNSYKNEANDSGSENKFYNDSVSTTYRRSGIGKHTSTPMLQREKHSSPNGQCEFISSGQMSPKKLQSYNYSVNQTSSHSDYGTRSTSDNSAWGTNASPKMRPKAGGMKTVQTVAGPLLASTRYNIDPKVYNDVTSPGLTTRLTKYATEANTKLTHQSQYSAGQFPRVNLHASPVPIINPKTAKIRSPVTVRIAPPDATRYSPPGRQKALSHMCQGENRSPPSVVQVLREISLKRHASREDVTFELPKKQRTDNIILERYELKDEVKQKRARDESSKSEEEISPQNKTVRPAKRTKTPSCYDIINSLSSSIHVHSGVKRKANYSRSGTPQFEKHFKSLETSPSTQIVPQPQSPGARNSAPVLKTTKNTNMIVSPVKSQEHSSLKGILKPSAKHPATAESPITKIGNINEKSKKGVTLEKNTSNQSVNLTDKLFMRPEPERNERLKMLADEQGSMKPKFTTDDVEEIKKADIVNMRKTSMKARLQSMFDAISGKAPSRINPDVVIEAEEINVAKPAPCPVTCATLNSLTTTTNVNTTPISTSAVAPVSPITGNQTQSPNQVVFNVSKPGSIALSSSPITTTTSTQSVGGFPSKPTVVSGTSPPVSSAGSNTSTGLSNATTTASGLKFGNQIPPVTSIPHSRPAVSSSGKAAPITTPALTTTTTLSTSVPSNTILGRKPTSLVSSTAENQIAAKSITSQTSGLSTAVSLSSTQAVPTFTFGGKTTSIPSIENTKSTTSSVVASTSSFQTIPSTSTMTTSTVTPSSTAASLFTFGNQKTNLQTMKAGGFTFSSSGTTSSSITPIQSTAISTQNSNTVVTTTVPVQPVSAPSSSVAVGKSTVPAFGAPTTSTFSFGAVTTSATNMQPVFAFGSNTPSTISSSSSTPTVTSTNLPTASTSTASTTTSSSSITFGSASTNATPQFGSTTPASSIFGSTSVPVIVFGGSSGQSVFSSPMTSVTSSSFPTSTTSVTSGTFGTSLTTKPAATFGTPSASGTTGAFGTPSTTAKTSTFATTSTSGTGLFGAPATTATASTFGTLASAGAASAFGTPSTSATSSTFGTSATAGPSSAFGASSTLGSGGAFGVPSNSNTASAFGAPTNFGTGSAFGTPKTTASLFGSTMSTPSTSSLTTPNATPIFGTSKVASPATTTSGAIFGANLGAPSGTASNSSTNLFSNANASTGSISTTTSGFTETNNIFGQSKPAVPFGASPSGFGGSAPLFGSQTTSTSTFGAQTISNSTAPSTFGGANTSTPAFGSIASPQAQNTSTSGFGSTPSLFGTNSATPAFGTPSSGFNAPGSSTFGSQNATSPTFGTVSNTSGFGDNKPSVFGSQTSGPSAFGTPNAPTPAFGANVSSANTNSSIFTFGAGQQKQRQQNPTFVFGNTPANNNNPSSSSTPFEFGATAPKPTTGFNFTPSGTAPTINFGTSGATTFNAATPGMFSIGSGSTAPRSRSARSRKPK